MRCTVKKILYLIPMFFLLFAGSCSDNSGNTAEDNQIVVKISDAADKPIEGAIISAYTETLENPIEIDTSDALGVFVLKKIDNVTDDINLHILHSDFEPIIGKLNSYLQKSGNDKKNVKIKTEVPDSCCGKIIINVVDSESLAALANCELKIKRENKIIRIGKTKQDGTAKFVNLCPGEYKLFIHNNNYQTTEFALLIENCDTIRSTFQIVRKDNDSCCNGRAIIYIKNNEDQPLSGVKVRLWEAGNNKENLYTNELGKVIFDNLCPGSYGVSYMKDNFTSGEFDFSIECNGVYEVTKTIEALDSCCDGKIKIFVKDSVTLEQLNGASVKIYKNGKLLKTTKVEAGYVLFADLCQGAYGFDIIKEGFQSIEFSLELGCNEIKEITKKLTPIETQCCNNRLKVFVKDSTSNSVVSGARVKIMREGQIIRDKTTETGGYVVFEELCKGTYTILIMKEGFANQEYHITFDCAENIEKTIKIKSNSTGEPCCTAKLKLRIKNAEYQYLENAEVKLRIGNELVNTLNTNAEGWVLFENLCVPPNEYNVRIYKEGYQVKESTFTFPECKTLQETIILETAK